MQFAVLGALEVIHDGRRVPLGGVRQRVVLARLLVDAGRVVPTDRLIEDVWNARPPATARKTLQKYVHWLRRALGAPVLRTAGPGYVLDVDDDALDARRFERLLAAGDFAAALDVWQGEVLADLPGIDFVVAERTRLTELRLVALEQRLEADLAAGRHPTAVAELADLVEAHPLRERLVVLQVLALYRSGRQVEALRAFERHRSRLAEEVGVQPATELRELEAAVLRHDPELDLPTPVTTGSAPATTPAKPADHRTCGNLSPPLTSLTGRTELVRRIGVALHDHRLVTLTGPGGVGKTRVAHEVGIIVAERHPGGIWVVDLAEVPTPDLVGRAVADTLRVTVSRDLSRDDTETLVEALVDRPPSVVLLDSCEHVVEACGRLVDQVLRRCPDIRVLATSRRPLGVASEHVVAVPPLAEQDALRLLVERARQATAGLQAEPMTSLEVVRLAEVCRDLDGLPLAIELVAGQLRARTPAEVGARLGDLLRFRRPGAAAAGPPRQRSLHDMVAGSHELLPPATRSVFARLGVFTGSLTLEGAEAVCSADGLVATGDVLGHVTTLVGHSLLLSDRRPSSATRYRLVNPMRLFALEQLAAAGAVAPTRRAHARFHLTLAEAAGPHLHGPSERIWQRRLVDEEPNLRAAMRWAAQHDPATAARMAAALWPYWAMTWGDPLAVDDLAPLLAPEGTGADLAADLRAWTLTVAADLAAHAGDARRAVPWAEAAVAGFRRLDDERGLACALVALGSARVSGGALADAQQALTTARELARRHGDPVVTAKVLRSLALVALRRGDGEQAAELVREELLWWTELGSRRGEADALGRLGVVTLHLGDHAGAADLCHRTIALLDGRDDPVATAYVRMTLADITRERGDVGAAAGLYEQVLADLRPVGDRRGSASALKNLATLAVGRGEPRRGAGLFRQAIALRHELGDHAGLVELIEGLALAFAASERHGHAVTLLTAVCGAREQAGSAAPADDDDMATAIAAGRAKLGADRFAAHCRLGRELPVDDAVVYALAAR